MRCAGHYSGTIWCIGSTGGGSADVAWGRLLPTALALACPAHMVCFGPAAPVSTSRPVHRHGPAASMYMLCGPSLPRLRAAEPRAPGAGVAGALGAERRSTLQGIMHSRNLARLTALEAKKGKGTAPNKAAKKGRAAYLAAKDALAAKRAAVSSEDGAVVQDGAQPRPGEVDTWTMEEAWEDHTQAMARAMTEAAPDFAQSAAVVEVALGAPEQWWREVVTPRLARIAAAAYEGLEASHGSLRVLDVGTGTGTMLPHLTAALPQGIHGSVVAVDVCEAMLDIVEERYPDVPLLTADFSALTPMDLHPLFAPDDVTDAQATPAEWAASGNGKVDVVMLNAVYSLMLDEIDTLEAGARLLRRGGRLVLSHPLGKAFVADLQKQVPDLIEHPLPSAHHLDSLIKYLPLKRRATVEEEELYITVLDRTPEQVLETALCMRGPVASGWGRGGKKLGVPTANLPESLFPQELRDVPTGVYLGWAGVDSSAEPIKAVVNVGYSPTFVGAENPEKVVEAHLFKEFAGDFYDKELRLMLTGYLRPEAKFAGFPLLLAAIKQDLADAKACLDQVPKP